MNNVTINTANGTTVLDPVFCEVTNEQIGWKTRKPPVVGFPAGVISPAFISFKVVSITGQQLVDTSGYDTF